MDELRLRRIVVNSLVVVEERTIGRRWAEVLREKGAGICGIKVSREVSQDGGIGWT